MSISSHLTPQPEQRLWIILELTREAVAQADRRIAALTALCAAEAFLVKAGPHGLWTPVALAPLLLVLPVGVLGFTPLTLTRLPGWLSFLEPSPHGASEGDCLVSCEDLAHHTHHELINRLDRYLGGGITATRYYEDIVGQILAGARTAHRKGKLLRACCLLAGVGQLGLVALLLTGARP